VFIGRTVAADPAAVSGLPAFNISQPARRLGLAVRLTYNENGSRPHPESSLSTAGSHSAESVAERYEILDVLARGQAQIVYRARDHDIGREVVVKVLDERYTHQSEAVIRVVEAAQITGQLQHPGIPPVYDIGRLADGRPFVVMKLIRGRTLQEILDEGADPAAERGRRLGVFEQVCQTVAYAHYRGVVHRDLKPAHIMIGAFGEVQVLGWGSARVLSRSPTGQADEGETDRRSDVFRLGEMLSTILTGRSNAAERLDECGAEAELVALAKRCLSPNPADRPPDACAVAQLVCSHRAAAEEQVHDAKAKLIAAQVMAAEQRKRRRVQFALVVAVVLLVAACLALALSRSAALP
jgi:serine/threonine-protein kinase